MTKKIKLKGNKKKIQKMPKKKVKREVEKNLLFSNRELNEIKNKLLEMRKQIVKTLEEKNKYDLMEGDVGDQIDDATNSLEKEVLFELSDNERQNLDNIEVALRKIENKKYGICEHCSKPIDRKRLKAIPQSRFCLTCQLSDEKYR